jgi:hypothetical protein
MVDSTIGMQTEAFAFFHTHKKEISDTLETIKKESHLIGKPERVENFLFKVDHDLVSKGCDLIKRLNLQIID